MAYRRRRPKLRDLDKDRRAIVCLLARGFKIRQVNWILGGQLLSRIRDINRILGMPNRAALVTWCIEQQALSQSSGSTMVLSK
ncbi:MAG: hypothetical protein Q8R08_00600 [bacterium]|nr:hypothetical protein [bacterium]